MTRRITARLSDEEMSAVLRECGERGLSISAFCREAIAAACRGRSKIQVEDRTASPTDHGHQHASEAESWLCLEANVLRILAEAYPEIADMVPMRILQAGSGSVFPALALARCLFHQLSAGQQREGD